MALIKDITFDDGIKTNYHMIAYYGIDVVDSLINITVNSYASKEDRDLEKQFFTNMTNQMKIRADIEEEQKKENPDEDLLNELNYQLTDFPINPNKCLHSTPLFFRPVYEEGKVYSLSDLYQLVLSTEPFTDAQND